MDKLSIAKWDIADRPREKLAAQGAGALSNAELLAILIGSGSPRESAVDLMRRLLADCKGSLAALGKMPLEELCHYTGIGPAKAVTIMAACEFGRRRAAEPAEERPRMESSAAIHRYFRPLLEDLTVEECHVLLLNSQLRVIASKRIGHGGITEAPVDVRVVLREALLSGATNIALCHNHPSGLLRPSKPDDKLTDSLKQAADLMRIRLIDHVIIASGGYYSYADEGRI